MPLTVSTDASPACLVSPSNTHIPPHCPLWVEISAKPEPRFFKSRIHDPNGGEVLVMSVRGSCVFFHLASIAFQAALLLYAVLLYLLYDTLLFLFSCSNFSHPTQVDGRERKVMRMACDVCFVTNIHLEFNDIHLCINVIKLWQYGRSPCHLKGELHRFST